MLANCVFERKANICILHFKHLSWVTYRSNLSLSALLKGTSTDFSESPHDSNHHRDLQEQDKVYSIVLLLGEENGGSE